jgi:hypothetical protein|tara:strand:- start:11982 stop:12593 length:612 start_codon:yes stop_codon:yes gene_type:complete
MATFQEEVQKVRSSSTRSVPGQSLSNDPENPAPFEKAPKFTSVHAASEEMFMDLIEPETYVSIMEAVDDGIPVMQITQMILFQKFKEGEYNPDLMIMMIEPVAYMIIALAERLDLDIIVDEDDDEDDIFGLNFKEDQLKQLKGAASTGAVPAGMLTPAMQEKMEDLPETLEETSEPEESLLSPPVAEEAPEETETPESLMARR